MRVENQVLNRELSIALDRIKELEEENRRLKEENQQLRLALYGIKTTKNKVKKVSGEGSKPEPKKRGPPRGHKGTSRRKPNRVDRTVVLKLEGCPHCKGELSELKSVRERYVEDIVPATLLITKYIIKQGYCRGCGKVVYPEVPEVIDNCHFGLNFLLYITYLRFVMNLPHNKIATLIHDTYNAKVSEGTIVDYLKRAAEIFGPEYNRIKRQMRELNCHYDDTGQRVNGENRWLWVFISNEIMLYHTSNSRSKKVVVEILGEDYKGVTVQDFYPSYDKAPGLKQKCWAHFLRDAKDLAEKEKPPPESIEFYKELKQIYKDAKESESQLNPENRDSEYFAFVEILDSFATRDWNHHDVKRLAKRAHKYKHELFTFLLIPGIESTNNRAERALRHCVVQRKIWGCHRTEEGAMNRDTLMSILGSSKLQGKNFFNYGKEYLLKALT